MKHRLSRPFSLRDLLWLALIIGLAVVWWLDRSMLKQRADDALRDMVAKHGHDTSRLQGGGSRLTFLAGDNELSLNSSESLVSIVSKTTTEHPQPPADPE